MANARKRRLRRSRRTVDRTERVKPTPESLQHYRAWPMQVLLHAGPEGGGIDADEFEAALQIVEAFNALTGELGCASMLFEGERISGALHGMSERDAMMVAVWLDWAERQPMRDPAIVVDWIEDRRPICSVGLLRQACRLWHRVRDEHARERSAGKHRCANTIDNTPPAVLPLCATSYLRPDGTAARAPYQPAQPFPPLAGLPARPVSPSPTGGQMCLARQRPDAFATALAPPGRLRR